MQNHQNQCKFSLVIDKRLDNQLALMELCLIFLKFFQLVGMAWLGSEARLSLHLLRKKAKTSVREVLICFGGIVSDFRVSQCTKQCKVLS